jgi:ABC-type ATPase with predicted acetyltransferase domain
MTAYTVSRRFPWQESLSHKAIEVCRMFGLTVDRLNDRAVTHECRLEIAGGDIVYITGPSGSGKSVLLRELQDLIGPARSIDLLSVPLPRDRSVIDCFEGPTMDTLRLLSLLTLNEVFCVLNAPALLSEGQRFRFRLAQALASGKPFIFADEFCSELDDVTAATVAFNVHKLARQRNATLIAASSRTDILTDLAPDVLVAKDSSGPANVIYAKLCHPERSEGSGSRIGTDDNSVRCPDASASPQHDKCRKL